MKTEFNRNFSEYSIRKFKGMALLDVILAIVIFAVGMLALASLQGNLTRSSSDANARTVGMNVAEELIEGLRTIEEIPLPDGATCATDLDAIKDQNVYQCISDSTDTVERGGVNYSVAATVEDFYLMPDFVSVTKNTADLPTGWDTTISSFKYIELTVSWADNAVEFQDAPTDDPLLGSGSVSVSSIVPSIPNMGAAKVAAEDDGLAGTPPVDYTPGLRPDIVSISLGDSKFKESTTPRPDVVRTNELSETWFDVITYNQANSGATFLRREEFLVISCECTLKAGSADNKGLMPTVWNGSEYSKERWEAKVYGVSANNQQSQYCDTCCRDHHDGASNLGDDVYDPSRGNNNSQWSEPNNGGDHTHYKRANNGGLSAATPNSTYVEACRMVRKDGFMRVTQDFRQEGFNGFPEGYLDTEGGVQEYSDYVTDSVDDMYGVNKNAYGINQDYLNDPSTYLITFPASNSLNATSLPFLLGANSQQMRARGIYVDQLSTKTSALVGCLQGNEGSYNPDAAPPNPTPGEQCASAGHCPMTSCRGITNHMQVLPFYELQTTWLNWWNMDDPSGPVSVSNEAVADDNAHSRGLAVLENPTVSLTQVEVELEMHRGNIGLTVTDSITEADESGDGDTDYSVFVDVNGTGGGSTPTGYVWESTTGSSVNKVDFSDVVISPNGNVICSRTSSMLSCFTPDGEAGSIDLSGYVKNIAKKNDPPEYLNMYICLSGSGDISAFSVNNSPDGVNNAATISWSAIDANVSGINISIEESTCP